MADDKSEEPTAKRLREARAKGQVAKSSDLTQAGGFIAAGAVLSFAGAGIVESLKALMIQSFQSAGLSGAAGSNVLIARFSSAWLHFLQLVAPIFGVLVISAIVFNFLQLGGLVFSFQVLTPKFEKLNPVQGFQNIFLKSRTYIELVKNLVKFAVVLWITYSTFRDSLPSAVFSARLGLPQTAAVTSQLMFALLFKVGGVFLILGAADFFIQKKMYIKGLRMSKEEVKKEYKEEEGDPHIKHQRKHLHQQLLAENMPREVAKATAVVVNPTHLAIAIQYNESTMAAPQVVAKGQMQVAQNIIQIAKKSGVPVVRNVPLAHSLFALELGAEIPENLYEAVAEILNLVYELVEARRS
jgi:flagellar biosynthetic protein FlhB